MTNQLITKAPTNRSKDELQNQIEQDSIKISYLLHIVNQKNNELFLATNRLHELESQLQIVVGTFRWRLFDTLTDWLNRIRLHVIMAKLTTLARRLMPAKTVIEPNPLPITTVVENTVQTDVLPSLFDLNPYKPLKLLKDIEVLVIDEDFDAANIARPFSTVTTILNEQATIESFLQSLLDQSLPPTEIVLVDGGSTDETVTLIKTFARSEPKIRLFEGKALNIPQGRNLGIKKAKHEIIVFADAGTILDKHYCKNLVGGFAAYDDLDLVGGTYYPIQASQYADAYIPDWQIIDWTTFLPSTRALAVKKSLARQVDYFPEYLRFGDDTLFDIKYRRISKKWLFNTKAFSLWEAPASKEQFEKVSHNYGVGDGESGVGDHFYYDLYSITKKALPQAEMPVKLALFTGYLEGKQRRAELEMKMKGIKGLVIFLTDKPLYDNGKRLKQALTLLAETFKIVCVNLKPSEAKEAKFLDCDYTLLELYYYHDFDLEELLGRYQKILEHTQVFVEKNQKYDQWLAILEEKKILISYLD